MLIKRLAPPPSMMYKELKFWLITCLYADMTFYENRGLRLQKNACLICTVKVIYEAKINHLNIAAVRGFFCETKRKSLLTFFVKVINVKMHSTKFPFKYSINMQTYTQKMRKTEKHCLRLNFLISIVSLFSLVML